MNKVIKIAMGTFIGVFVFPVVLDTTIYGATYAYKRYKALRSEVEEGFEDGSIVKIKGGYYRVVKTKEES